MAETKTESSRAPKAGAPDRRAGTSAGRTTIVERTTELSEDVLGDLEEGARDALDAVRRFTETVDKALPPDREGRSRAEEITDSALEMAQRLVHTQAEFLRKVVDSAGSSLGGSRTAK